MEVIYRNCVFFEEVDQDLMDVNRFKLRGFVT